MKKINIRHLVLLFCILNTFAVFAENLKPFVIPEIKEWKGKDGVFTVNSSTKVVCRSNTPQLAEVAKRFVEDYRTMFGVELEIADGRAGNGDIVFELSKKKGLGKEGYTIDIDKKVVVTASAEVGIFWGTRTLLQISEQSEERSLPKGFIKDFPDYGIRGFMLDCGRKFIPMSYLRDFMKIMSYYKMNTFQIHLNDNGFKQFFDNDWNKTYAAFRLECDTYPGLTARDGYYTKKEFGEFQDEASSYFVEIIPEIDAPAHTLAFSHYNPSLGSKKYGMDHLDLFNPETYKFMDGLFKEYLSGDKPVFRGPKVHIGTDEYSNKDKEVVEKFREFTDRYIKYVESFGKQACVWGALTHAKGETPVKSENVIMSAWYNGYADPQDMVKQGYKLISIPDGLMYIVPAAGYYYDYLNTKHLYESWTPAHVGKSVFEERDPAILGGMYAVWNDHVGNGISVKDIHHRSFPALQTLSAKMWTGKNVSVPFEEFDKKRNILSEAPGVNQLGRISKSSGLAYQADEIKAGMEMPFEEVGYGYSVEFDITAEKEDAGTELFRSSSAVIYLSDPIDGMMSFARDGYRNSFGYQLYPGEKAHICIEGDNKSTILKVNGKTVKTLDIGKIYFGDEKTKINNVRTLVFPLKKAGCFKSKITNFKIHTK